MSNKIDYATLSAQLEHLKPGEKMKVFRYGDQLEKAILIRKGLEKGVWTQSEVAEWLNTDIAQVSRLLSSYAPKG